ncbi:MAG TPA: Hsp70 family protein [Kofleriaceae bacterium]|nr:Hsp70 family protein [Kofleriaceae bacterium]
MPPAAPLTARELILGLDFGTSYSSAGVLLDGKVDLVRDDGETATPSVVHMPPRRGEPVIGTKAVARLASDPGTTVTSIKRLLGRSFEDPVVRRTQQWAAYKLKRSPQGRVLVELGGADYACEQIAGWIMARLRTLAETRFGARIQRAVVATPVAASGDYVTALKTAARLAGLDIIQTIPEPIAAALAVGMHIEPAERRLVVCDFGGGTFDVTLMAQDALSFRPLAIDGDEFLGGDDFDEVLAAAIGGVIYQKASYDINRDVVRAQQLRHRCESVKRLLSTRNEAPLLMRDAYLASGRSCDLNSVVERSWIEPRWEPLVDRAVQVTQRLLDRGGCTAEQITHVVLVGGGTLMPLVRRRIAEMFPAAQQVTGDYAQVAIAAGAVLQTAAHLATTAQVPRLAEGA